MFNPIDRYRSFLEARGMRLTRERETVVRTLLTHSVSCSPEQIAQLVSVAGISRATVYRTLNQLEEAGVLAELSARQIPGRDDPSSLRPFCRIHHPQLKSGTCRWCGRSIIDGEIDSGAD